MFVLVDGSPTALEGGRLSVAVQRAPGAGLRLTVEDGETGASYETTLALDPSQPDGLELFEWPAESLLVLGGVKRVVGLEVPTLQTSFSLALMEGEGTTTEGLRWRVRDDSRFAALATEARVWVLGPGPRVRISWATRGQGAWTQTLGDPRFVGGRVEIDVRDHRADAIVSIDLASGAWEPS